MQKLFGRKVTKLSGSNTANEIELSKVKVLGLEEYKEQLKMDFQDEFLFFQNKIQNMHFIYKS